METKSRQWLAAFAGGIFALTAGHAWSAGAAPLGCLIEPERVADIGSPVVGVIDSLRVDRGDAVSAGQALAVLRADVERANVNVAEGRAKLEADVAAAAANLQLARQKLTRSEQLQAVNFISKQALEQAAAEHEVAVQKLAQAKEQVQTYGRELGVAQAQLGLRTVRSPFGGVVVERYLNPGERVEDKPMLKVAMIDPLRVEVMLPVSQYGNVTTGTMLTVRPEVPGAQPVSARVTRVDKVVDPASNTFRVRLALPNPGHKLPAGLRCKVDLPGANERTAAAESSRKSSDDRVATVTRSAAPGPAPR